MLPSEIKRLFPFASQACLRRNAADDPPGRVVPNPQREQDSRDEPVAADAGETARKGRLRIVVTSYRYKLLDDDNVALGAKPLVDCVVAAGIVPSDSKVWCDIAHRQEQVTDTSQERTEILLENL